MTLTHMVAAVLAANAITAAAIYGAIRLKRDDNDRVGLYTLIGVFIVVAVIGYVAGR